MVDSIPNNPSDLPRNITRIVGLSLLASSQTASVRVPWTPGSMDSTTSAASPSVSSVPRFQVARPSILVRCSAIFLSRPGLSHEVHGIPYVKRSAASASSISALDCCSRANSASRRAVRSSSAFLDATPVASRILPTRICRSSCCPTHAHCWDLRSYLLVKSAGCVVVKTPPLGHVRMHYDMATGAHLSCPPPRKR